MKNLLETMNDSTRSLKDFIKESIEDGKYLDLPTQMYKPTFGPGMPKPKQSYSRRYRENGKTKTSTGTYSDSVYANMLKRWEESNAQQKAKNKEAEDAWKKHIELIKKIDAENFEILINKMFDLLENKERRENFIKTMVAQIIEDIKNTQNRGGDNSKKVWREKNMISNLNSLRNSIQLDNDSTIKGSWTFDAYEEDIYDNLYRWGSIYGIQLPQFSREKEAKNSLFAKTAHQLMDEFVETSGRRLSDEAYSKKYNQFIKQVEKDKQKIAKFRAAWSKTEQYKKLLKIVDMIEDDVETVEKTVDRAYTRFDELNGKNKAYRKAQNEVKDRANEYLEKVFKNTMHAVSCYGKSLIDILTMIKLSGQDDPEIEIIDQNTSSWMSGMRHSCKFKVVDSEGNEYVTGKYEDRGFDSFERTPGDGFSAWD